MQRSERERANKKVAIFFTIILGLVGGVFGWLMFVEPPVGQQEIVKEIAYDQNAM